MGIVQGATKNMGPSFTSSFVLNAVAESPTNYICRCAVPSSEAVPTSLVRESLEVGGELMPTNSRSSGRLRE